MFASSGSRPVVFHDTRSLEVVSIVLLSVHRIFSHMKWFLFETLIRLLCICIGSGQGCCMRTVIP